MISFRTSTNAVLASSSAAAQSAEINDGYFNSYAHIGNWLHNIIHNAINHNLSNLLYTEIHDQMLKVMNMAIVIICNFGL
jgi:hypothetical protein